MNYCEDYPCCGHGPAPLGDSGGCPDSEGRFNCVLCGVKLPRGNRSAICNGCRFAPRPTVDLTGQDEEVFNGR
jgi:hypothetical protein